MDTELGIKSAFVLLFIIYNVYLIGYVINIVYSIKYAKKMQEECSSLEHNNSGGVIELYTERSIMCDLAKPAEDYNKLVTRAALLIKILAFVFMIFFIFSLYTLFKLPPTYRDKNILNTYLLYIFNLDAIVYISVFLILFLNLTLYLMEKTLIHCTEQNPKIIAYKNSRNAIIQKILDTTLLTGGGKMNSINLTSINCNAENNNIGCDLANPDCNLVNKNYCHGEYKIDCSSVTNIHKLFEDTSDLTNNYNYVTSVVQPPPPHYTDSTIYHPPPVPVGPCNNFITKISNIDATKLEGYRLTLLRRINLVNNLDSLESANDMFNEWVKLRDYISIFKYIDFKTDKDILLALYPADSNIINFANYNYNNVLYDDRYHTLLYSSTGINSFFETKVLDFKLFCGVIILLLLYMVINFALYNVYNVAVIFSVLLIFIVMLIILFLYRKIENF